MYRATMEAQMAKERQAERERQRALRSQDANRHYEAKVNEIKNSHRFQMGMTPIEEHREASEGTSMADPCTS